MSYLVLQRSMEAEPNELLAGLSLSLLMGWVVWSSGLGH